MTLLSILNPGVAQTGVGLVNDDYEADTLGAAPSGYTVESGALWQVLAMPTRPDAFSPLFNKRLAGLPNTTDDGFLRKTFTRQVDGEIRIQYDIIAPSVTTGRGPTFQLLDTTGAYVLQLVPINAAWAWGNSSGSNGTVGSWVSLGIYTVVIVVDMDQKKFKFAINNVTFDNAGALYPITTGATGVDRFKLGAFSSSTASFSLDHVQIGTLAPTMAPPTGTGTASWTGTFDGVTLGSDRFGRVTVGYDNSDALITRLTTERSNDGSTWADISDVAVVANTGTGRWTVTDRRPHYDSESVAYGGTVFYRVSGANSGGTTPSSTTGGIVADVDKAAYEAARFPVISSLMGGTSVPSSSAGEAYASYPLAASAYAYLRTGQAQYLTDASNQFSYLQTLTQANDVIMFPDYDTAFYRDFHWRTVLHCAAAARVLRRSTGGGTLAASMIAECDTWAAGWFNNLNSGAPLNTTATRAGWDANNDSTAGVQQARQASTAYTVGDIVRPVATNSRTYRATAVSGITGAGTPTWPTTDGGTVVDGGVTWTETTVTGSVSFGSFDTVSPFTAVAGTDQVDLNQVLEEVAACVLLLTDPQSALFSVGALRTEALAAVADESRLITAYATSTGALPVGDPIPAVNGPEGYDTLYGAYALELMALAIRYGPTLVDQRLSAMLTRGMTWLNTGYGTEPLTHVRYSGEPDSLIFSFEYFQREVPSLVLGIANPVEKLRYTAAANVPASERLAQYYQVNGLTSPASDAWQSRSFMSDIFIELLQPQRDAVVMAPMLAA